MTPIFWPARSLKIAIDFFAFVTTGFCPVMAVSSSTAVSSTLGCVTAAPRPMLMVTFLTRGTSITFARLNSCFSLPRISVSYSVRRRAGATRCTRTSASAWVAPAPFLPLPLPSARAAFYFAASASCSGVSAGRFFSVFSVCSAMTSSVPLPLRRLEGGAALHAHAPLLAAGVDLRLGAAGVAALRAPQRHVRRGHARLFLDDAAARAALCGLGVTLHHFDPLDQDAVLRRRQAQHASALALLLAGDDDDLIALTDMDPRTSGHHRTSGASEMIFMNFLARSSRATGPKIRVPMGSLSLSTSTAELTSKRM